MDDNENFLDLNDVLLSNHNQMIVNLNKDIQRYDKIIETFESVLKEDPDEYGMHYIGLQTSSHTVFPGMIDRPLWFYPGDISKIIEMFKERRAHFVETLKTELANHPDGACSAYERDQNAKTTIDVDEIKRVTSERIASRESKIKGA